MMLSFSVDVEEWRDYCSPYSKKITIESPSEKFRKLALLDPLRKVLDVFEHFRVQSTFFVLGQTAQSFPEAIEGIRDLGHEIASHSFSHCDLTQMSKKEFERVELKNIEILTKIAGNRPTGFRAPAFSISTRIINSLERLGYAYDSSVAPSLRIPGYPGYHSAPMHPYHPSRRDVFRASRERKLVEVPVAAFPILHFPAGGGWLLRNIGVSYIKTAVRFLLRREYPVVLYVHLQDLTSLNPRTTGVPFHEFRNCGRYALRAMRDILQSFPVKKTTISEIVSSYDRPENSPR